MNSLLTLKKKGILKYLAVVIIFSSWIIFYTLPRALQYPLFFIPAIILIFYSFYPYKRDKFIAFCLFSIVIFRYFIPEDVSLTNISFYAAMVRALMISSLFLIDDKSLRFIYHYFKKILFLVIVISLPFYLLYVVGLLPIGQIATYVGEGGGGRTWNVYPFFSLQNHPLRGEIIRFPAIFDEPGYLGVILAFVLAIEKLDVSSLKNKIFLLSGILTFSLAFYSLVFIFIIISVHVKLKFKLYATLIAVILIGLGAIFFQEQLEQRVIERVVSNEGYLWDTSGRVGIDRQRMIIAELSRLDSNQLYFGAGYQAGGDEQAFASGVTWERLVLQLGIVFTTLFLGLIFYYGSVSVASIVFSILFIVSMFQRPAVFAPIWFFLLIYGIFTDNKMNHKKHRFK